MRLSRVDGVDMISSGICPFKARLVVLTPSNRLID
jgi:hypothetical protein